MGNAQVASQATPNEPILSSSREDDDADTMISPQLQRDSSKKMPKKVDADVDTEDAIEILFQFIPFYGQGDTSNDSIVRSTLSDLPVEDIDRRDQYGNTLLLAACQYRCEALVRIMLNKGADPNSLNTSGASCLHFACYKESMSKSIAKALLQNGANPEVCETTYGCTPLHYAAGTGDVDFCKMLVSYGSVVGTCDYYNYTAVDYAREAGMTEASAFLQKKMLMTSSMGAMSFSAAKGSGAAASLAPKTSGSVGFPSPTKSIGPTGEDDWTESIDPTTGGKYYVNLSTGECLWESDYLRKREEHQRANPSAPPAHSAPPAVEEDILAGVTGIKRVDSREDMSYAIDVFSSTAPVMKKKSSVNLPGQLLSSNSLSHIAGNFDAATVSPSLMGSGGNGALGLSHSNMSDSAALQRALQEAKGHAEEVMQQERLQFSHDIAEKEGHIAKLESEQAAFIKEREKLLSEISDMKSRLEVAAMSGGEAIKKYEEMVTSLEKENSELKSSLSEHKSTLAREREKLTSLQDTLDNLESGHAERARKEQEAAEERARHMQQLEMEHIAEVREIENKLAENKVHFQEILNQAKAETARVSRIAEDHLDLYKKKRDQEADELSRTMNEKLAKLTEELSNAKALAEANRKRAADEKERADEVEAAQRGMVEEVERAREISQYNAQLHRDLGREQKLRKKLHNDIEDMKGRIRVYVRVRPLSNSEQSKNCQEAVIKDGKVSVLLKGVNGPDSKKNYDFDQVFGGSSKDGNSQQDVFRDTKHLMLSVIDGYNVCIFAYGQTGSGKTFTMIGASDIGSCLQSNGEFDDMAGITPRAVSELFRLLNERHAQCTVEVTVQMFQLYRDGLEDLLSGAGGKKKAAEDPFKRPTAGGTMKITLAEHSPTGLVHIEGAECMVAESPADVMRIFQLGASRRTTASTQMNAESSRSHLICSLVVTLTNRHTGVATTGKLTLVDLAGSERVDKSGAVGEVLKEAQSINKSLSALGDVIAALTSGGAHVPYRNHPLTMLMSDSIGGNAKTLMFVNCSPADYNVSESNSSLAFASRCKDVRNSTAAPAAMQAQQLNALKKELTKLKKEKGGAGGGGAKLARPV